MKNILFSLLLLFSSQLYAANGDVGISLKDDAVTSAKILDGEIVAADIADSTITTAKLDVQNMQSVDVAIANAALDTMNATPVQLVAAPGSGKAVQVTSVFCFNDFVTAALELGSGTLDVRYENSSGGLAAQFTNAWAESAADAYMSAPGLAVVALTNKAIVMHASADITSGGGNLACRVHYRTITISDI